MSVVVECPICGAEIRCSIDPGEPMVMYYADGSGHPGSPAGLDEIDPDCECADSPLVKHDKYMDAVEDLALRQADRDWGDE